MALDVIDIRSFYAGPLGRVTKHVISDHIRQRWHKTQSLAVLGLGYATPYLDAFVGEAERVISVMPARQGVVNWPNDRPSATVLASSDALPFPNASIDRVLVIHGLETQDNPQDMLSELWRILTPGGQLMIVTPNRRGLWARVDKTPFGHGQPFSRRQLTDLLREALFSPSHWSEALHFPPFKGSMLAKTAVAWEKLGSALALPFAGVHIVEATKLLYRPIMVSATQRSRAQLSPILVPAGSPRLDESPL
ncbi:MAG: methyltransferase domain-containing protein [Alphaproteobacteria bacterium]|jgi:SAM-dependent methyltransferase|nr:methyltransferase domain-containing protein [Beijerinckiaceae bacterium]NBQ38613.1 methyltransferase domain-containing protein [Alphaproteobacteria bacterium]